MYIIISGDTNDHRGMRIQVKREGGGEGGEDGTKIETEKGERSQNDHKIKINPKEGWPPRRPRWYNSHTLRTQSPKDRVPYVGL